MEVILKTLEENYLLIDDFSILTGQDVYRIGQICFFLGKQINKQVTYANNQVSHLEQELRETSRKLE